MRIFIIFSLFLLLSMTDAKAFSTLNSRGEICHLVEIENSKKVGDYVWVMNVDTGEPFMMHITHIDKDTDSSEITGVSGIDESGNFLGF